LNTSSRVCLAPRISSRVCIRPAPARIGRRASPLIPSPPPPPSPSNRQLQAAPPTAIGPAPMRACTSGGKEDQGDIIACGSMNKIIPLDTGVKRIGCDIRRIRCFEFFDNAGQGDFSKLVSARCLLPVASANWGLEASRHSACTLPARFGDLISHIRIDKMIK
jgi:hypothetical protein